MSISIFGRLNPPYSYMKEAPMTASEIDEHVDSDRIWATIVDVTDQCKDEMRELEGENSNLHGELQRLEDESPGQLIASSEVEIRKIHSAFQGLTAPRGLTKANLSEFSRLFETLIMHFEDHFAGGGK